MAEEEGKDSCYPGSAIDRYSSARVESEDGHDYTLDNIGVVIVASM